MSTTATLTPTPAATPDPTGGRCDRCPQAGQVRYTLTSGLDLVLCGHHSRDHGVQLVAAGAAIELVTR